ncbi:hypothetical protein [Deinococcus sp.]|uniref:hypothetical protein n=1 Tax=Deinococcus sp. TaxID=47478 RepID=UPI0025E75B83|nr:hypothetical protein [Deinococcus sp.]
MLTIHLLGHSYISQDGRPVKAPIKGLALLVYLTLQRRPQHREHLAELMWDTPDALRNLRVELNRLHHLGLDLFPARQPLLELKLPTDLERWTKEADTLPESRLSEWLSLGTSLPLSGLEDLGSSAFREWIDNQRWVISQTVEATLSRVHVRALQSGRVGAASMIRAQAEQLGLELHGAPHLPAWQAGGGGVQFERREVRQRLEHVLQRAKVTPQLVVLSGRSECGKRELIAQAVGGSDWRVIQMQAVAPPELQQATFLHQLMRVLPPDLQAEAWALLKEPGTPNEDLIRAWTLVAASGQPLLVAWYDLHLPAPSLLSSLRFAMELPSALMLVVSPPGLGSPQALRGALGSVDRSRLHHLDLPGLAVHEVMDALAERQALLSRDQRRAYATRVVQQSDGWDLHARELIDSGAALAGPHLPLPRTVRGSLVGELGHLSPALRQALARWAVAHSPLNVDLASLLSAQSAGELPVGGLPVGGLLAEAVERELLRTASPQETILMPELDYQASDLDDQLCFVSEPLRVALAGTLTTWERRELRARLAADCLADQPELSRYYARRVVLSSLALPSQASAAPTNAAPTNAAPADVDRAELNPPELNPSEFSQPETGQLQLGQIRVNSRVAGGPPGQAGGIPVTARATLRLAPEFAEVEGGPTLPRQERRTGNGYRVATERGQIQVLRNGLHAAAPLLRLLWPPVQAGHWRLVARLDVYGSAPELSAGRVPYALGLRAGSGPRLTFNTEPVSENGLISGTGLGLTSGQEGGRFEDGGVVHSIGDPLPLAIWFALEGWGEAGPLELSVRAVDIALTIAEFRWSDTVLVPTELAGLAVSFAAPSPSAKEWAKPAY